MGWRISKSAFAGVSILVLVAVSQLNFKTSSTVVPELRQYLLQELDLTIKSLEQLKTSSTKQQENYTEARKHYKHLEFFIEYYSPREAKYDVNGPLVPKHDIENGRTVVEPKGFQKIEELLFSGDPIDQKELIRYADELIIALKKFHAYYESAEINETMLLEMPQLQFHRLASLTLNGYDATINQQNVQEAIWSLEGVNKVLQCFQDECAKNSPSKKSWQLANKQLGLSLSFLKKNTDYNSFDRLTFITTCLEPLNDSWIDLHNSIRVKWQVKKQALNLQKKGLFQKQIWNLPYFSIYYADTLTTQLQAELGKLLFFDPILSGNGQRSCASCHKADKAFAENLSTSQHFDGMRNLERNAPTLLNVSLQQAFFHDGRVGQLEQQAFDVVHNEEEMAGNMALSAKKLAESEEYRELFSKAFPAKNATGITVYQIQKALAEYERSLVTLNSRFDAYITGNKTALDSREKNGYNLFAGKALCGSCHFFPLFNGTVPPFYADSEFEVIGTPVKNGSKELSKDQGRFKFTKLDIHRSSFKTPTVRNIEHTAPYMHNGSFDKLEDVVEFYHKGGGKGLGIVIENQTLPFDSLQLKPTEKEDIVLFLKSLTDQGPAQTAPTSLPKFGNAVLDERKIGGIY